MKLLSSKKKFLILVRQPDNNWAHAWVTLRPGGLVPKYVRVGEDRYRFEPKHSWLLKGGDPTRHDGFWSAFIDFVNGGDRGFYSAQVERESVSGCGPDARWFEAFDAKVAA